MRVATLQPCLCLWVLLGMHILAMANICIWMHAHMKELYIFNCSTSHQMCTCNLPKCSQRIGSTKRAYRVCVIQKCFPRRSNVIGVLKITGSYLKWFFVVLKRVKVEAWNTQSCLKIRRYCSYCVCTIIGTCLHLRIYDNSCTHTRRNHSAREVWPDKIKMGLIFDHDLNHNHFTC